MPYIIKPPYNTLHTTTSSYRISLTLYNLTLVEYNRTLYIVVDGILPYIAAHCRILPIYHYSRQNIVELAEYSRIW